MFISYNIVNSPNKNIIKVDFHAHICITICIFRCNNICRKGIILSVQLELGPCGVGSVKTIRYAVSGSIQIFNRGNLLTINTVQTFQII